MAQNVERNINVKVNMDTGQAVSAMQRTLDALGLLVGEAMKLSKLDIVSEAQINGLNKLQDQFFKLVESEKLTENELDAIITQFNQFKGNIQDVQAKFDMSQISKFAELMGTINSSSEQFKNLVPTSIYDENALDKIRQANALYEELSDKIRQFENGQRTFADRKAAMEELKNSMNEYSKALENANVTEKELLKYQELLQTISNGNAYKALQGNNQAEKVNTEEEKRRQEVINKINKEYEDTIRKQNQQEELEKRITAEAEKRAKLEEEFNKRREDAAKRQAELQENLNKTYSELGGGGLSAPDGAFAQSINDLAAQAGSESNASFGELFSNLNISDKLLSAFANKIGISTTELKALGEALGFSAGELIGYAGAAAVVVAGLKLLIDNTKEMITTFKNVGAAIGENAFQGIEWFVDSLQNMVDMAEQAIQTLDKLAEAGTTIERAFLTTSAYIGQDATDQVYDFMQSISGASKTMFASINDVVAAAGSMGLASDQLVEATENMTVMGRNLGVLIGDTQKAFADLGQTISKGYVGRNSILYRIFTKQEIDQVRKLSNEVERYNFILERAGRVQELYNAYIETASGKVSLMKMQYQELMNNIGLVALNLYAIVAPVLTKILTIANQLLSVLISVFGWEPKSVGFTSIASDIGNSLDNVAESASKANKQLASFDDVIQINDSKSGGGGVGGIDPQALGDFSGLLDDALNKSDDFVNLWEHFKELMSEGDYFGAGTEFMHVIGDLLRSIDWDKIKSDVRDVAADISRFINGLFDEDARKEWEEVGKFIGEAINTAFAFLKELLQDVDFKDIGKSLGAAWSAMWDTINAKDIADTLYYAVIDAFDLLAGWLEGGGLSKAASKIAEIIKGFFTNFSEVDLGDMTNTVVGVVNDILNAIKTVVDALTSDDVKEVVFGLITKLVNAFKENGAEWGKTIHDIIADIMDFIIEGINTADKAGIKGAFMEFITNLRLSDLLAKYLQIKWAIFKEKVVISLTTFFSSIVNFLLDGARSIGAVIQALLAEIVFIIGETLAVIIGAVLGFGTNIAEALSSIGEGMIEKFKFNIESIKLLFTTLWDFITGIFDGGNWLDLGKQAIESLWQGIKDIWNNTIGSWSFDIPGFTVMDKTWDGIHFSMPKLATGGIVTSATTALIGEAGKEAVLPLDNNTQWMDKLASKINNNGSNAGGTVRVELSDKPFYTRAEMYEFGSLIVESLKAYGLNIAIV